ncbi:MAG: YkgJ family cysteine cluster protein [Lentimicrobium sp.]|nr:YkgJ family cysteine cluster protein [Lentimicrobium sp.]
MKCRPGCGACCIFPSISSPIPGMPDGKPAFARCIHLSADYKCNIFNHPDRPKVCAGFRPEVVICGKNQSEAEQNFRWLLE